MSLVFEQHLWDCIYTTSNNNWEKCSELRKVRSLDPSKVMTNQAQPLPRQHSCSWLSASDSTFLNQKILMQPNWAKTETDWRWCNGKIIKYLSLGKLMFNTGLWIILLSAKDKWDLGLASASFFNLNYSFCHRQNSNIWSSSSHLHLPFNLPYCYL